MTKMPREVGVGERQRAVRECHGTRQWKGRQVEEMKRKGWRHGRLSMKRGDDVCVVPRG